MTADELVLFPHTKKRRSTRGTTLRVEAGRRTCWLHGAGVKALIDRVAAPSQWDPRRRCWMVSVNRADDVITAAELWQHRVVTVEAVDR